ncbi:hypothetical protein [Streptomyces sp. NBC_00286]|uniref:hypothetical protein n=1 Tax=Streptomyces sp. NBC_00286 TaxID=2975701 RepID=UPI002E2A4950|nr:hypothetical protein [Streptomyces sp. NBC_00286]
MALVGGDAGDHERALSLDREPECVGGGAQLGHLRRICAKLDVDTRVHAARVAWLTGVSTPHPTAELVPELAE